MAAQGEKDRRRRDAGQEEEFSYAALSNRWRRERASTQLTHMDGRFYEMFDEHLVQLRDDYQREQAVGPATPKVLILLDELTNLQRVREDLYDLREQKIARSAVVAAREGRPDKSHMTREEEALYDGMLRVLQEARRSLLRKPAPEPAKPLGGPSTPLENVPSPALAAQPASLMPERESATETPLETPPAAAPRTAPPSERVEAASDEVEPARAQARVLVRVTKKVEPFVAPDLRHYRLEAEDVAALPRDVAHVLVARGIAVALSG